MIERKLGIGNGNQCGKCGDTATRYLEEGNTKVFTCDEHREEAENLIIKRERLDHQANRMF